MNTIIIIYKEKSLAIYFWYSILPLIDAGWSSLVARRAHNPKVVGSNPAPATIFKNPIYGVFYYLGPSFYDKN